MCSTSRNQQPEGIRGTAQLNEQREEGVQGRKPLIQCHRVRPPINIDDSEQSSGRWSGHEGFQSEWTSLRNRLVRVQNELSGAGERVVVVVGGGGWGVGARREGVEAEGMESFSQSPDPTHKTMLVTSGSLYDSYTISETRFQLLCSPSTEPWLPLSYIQLWWLVSKHGA